MATSYNKPDVYVEETLTPEAPLTTASANSVAAFIGTTDRGPTTTLSGNTVGVPTLITSWSDFINKFGFGSYSSAFSTSGTTNADMKYAIKSFFDNGGNQAYVLRKVNTDATKAAVSFRDKNGALAHTGTYTFTSTATSVTVTTSTAGTPFSAFYVGGVVTFSGSVPAGYSFLTASGKSWVVTAASAQSITVNAVLASPPGSATAASGVTIAGSISANASLTVTAKDAGTWGNSVWVSTQPSAVANYFDLYVYYAPNASVSADVTDATRVEYFPQLSMTTSDARYAPAVVTSSWITLTDAGSAATGTARLPEFSGTWSTSASAVSMSPTDGSFVWNRGGFASTPAKLGTAANNHIATSPAPVVASNGSAAPNISTVTLPRLDSVTGPLILNMPAVTAANDVNAALDYSATRGDIFTIVDSSTSASVSSALATASTYTNNKKYGAVYYPAITIADPASKTGGTIDIPTGGAVSAIYVGTDTKRGVFKAPAGTGARIASAVSVLGLSNADFDSISAADTPINVIRFIPGAGICVMGARTLSSTYSDKYVPTRRTLIYLRRQLVNLTQFAVFEPNDQATWAKVTSTLENFLYRFWNNGGLYGGTPASAYYIKCDASTNTTAAINAGELRIEIGVALQKPAEFVIIKIGQLDGGATVTTSI